MKAFCKLLVGLSVLLPLQGFGSDAGKGESIFKQRCTACHEIGSKLVGPALKDVSKRRSASWIIQFVHGSQKLIKSGDKEAVTVFNENNQVVMPDHSDLSDADIQNIVAYIEKAGLQVAANIPAHNRPAEAQSNEQPLAFSDYGFWALYGIFAMLVIVSLRAVVVAVEWSKRE